MKNKKIKYSIILLVALFFGVLAISFWGKHFIFTNGKIFYLNDIKNGYDISYTIDNPRAAVEYLKIMKKIDIKELENIEKQSKTNIIITVTEKNKNGIKDWIILVKTQKIIPSFSCEYVVHMFSSKTDDVIVKACGYNK